MRVVFFGTPELAVPSLAALAQAHEVVAVVCQPDRPQGRGKKTAPPPVKLWAEEHGLAVHQPAKLNDGTFEEWLKAQSPELGAVAAYGRLLKQPLLDVPAKGWLNMHPSLLPRYRGASPIQSAIRDGKSVTGVTIMDVVLAMDAGDILLQESTPIGPDENAAQLGERLAEIGARLLVQAAGLVAAGEAVFQPQDPASVTVCRPLEKADGLIDWRRPAQELHNLVRAVYPWPSAQCRLQGEPCRIHRSTVRESAVSAAPGEITDVERDRVWVATGAGELAILEFQAPGKKAMPMDAFLRGRPMRPGERFDADMS